MMRFCNRLRNFSVVAGLHGVLTTALGLGAQIRCVAEHLRQRKRRDLHVHPGELPCPGSGRGGS